MIRQSVRSGTSLTPQWRSVLMLDPCVYCGDKAAGLDHIRAATRGGQDGWENRAPACSRCDQEKRKGIIYLTPLTIWRRILP